MPLSGLSLQDDIPRIQDVLRDGPYQTTLPDGGGPSLDLGPGGAGIPLWLFFGLIGIVLVALLIALFRGSRPQARPRKAAAEPLRGAAHEVVTGERELPDPEELAGAGDFAGAVHALLLAALRALAMGERTLRRSWTSRQILREVALPDGARQPLGDLVRTVERTQFGPDPATREDYEESRDRYREFSRHLPGAAA